MSTDETAADGTPEEPERDDVATASARSPWWTILHPVLAGTVTVLALWAGNVVDVPVRDGLVLTGILAVAGAGLWALLTVGMRQRPSASALVATPILLIVSLVGWIGFLGPIPRLVVVAAVCVGTLFLVGRSTASVRKRLNILASVVMVSLVASNGLTIVATQPEATSDGLIASSELGGGGDSGGTAVDDDQRDVWIIVPDRYPNEGALQRRGMDGTGLTSALEERGFDVMREATSNYPQTLISLASAWNFELYDAQGKSGPAIGAGSVGAIDNHLLGQGFKERGYDYAHLGSWTDFTSAPSVADEILTLDQSSELNRAWIDKSAIAAALQARGWDYDTRGRQRKTALQQLQVLDELAEIEDGQPRLVIAHLLLPHPPYVFTPDGGEQRIGLDETSAFDQQRQFFDSQLVPLVDQLQARSRPPLIIVAADEGDYPLDWDEEIVEVYDWSTVSADDGRDKLAILAAVYDPDPQSDERFPLADDMSLVNIMRWLANRSLDADFDRLPDDHYLYRTTGWQELRLIDFDGETLD